MAIGITLDFLRDNIKKSGSTSPKKLVDLLKCAPSAVRETIGSDHEDVLKFVKSFPNTFNILHNGGVELCSMNYKSEVIRHLVNILKVEGKMNLVRFTGYVNGLTPHVKDFIGYEPDSLLRFLRNLPFIFCLSNNQVGLLIHRFTKNYEPNSRSECSVLLHVMMVFIGIWTDARLTVQQIFSEMEFYTGKNLSTFGFSSVSDLKNILKKACNSAVLGRNGSRFVLNEQMLTKDVLVHLLVSVMLEHNHYLAIRCIQEQLSHFGLSCEHEHVFTCNRFHKILVKNGFVGLSTTENWKACIYLLDLLQDHDYEIDIQRITGCLSSAPEIIRSSVGRNARGIKAFALQNKSLFILTTSATLISRTYAEEETVRFFISKLRTRANILVWNVHTFFNSCPEVVAILRDEIGVDEVMRILEKWDKIFSVTWGATLELKQNHELHIPRDNSDDDISSCSSGHSSTSSYTGRVRCIFNFWGLISCGNFGVSERDIYFTEDSCPFLTGRGNLRQNFSRGQLVEFDIQSECQAWELEKEVVANVRPKPIFTDTDFTNVLGPVSQNNVYARTPVHRTGTEAFVSGRDVILSHLSILKAISWLLICEEKAEVSYIYDTLKNESLKKGVCPLSSERDLITFLQFYGDLFQLETNTVYLKQTLYADKVSNNMIWSKAGFIGRNGTEQNAYFRASNLQGYDGVPFDMGSIKPGTPVKAISLPVECFPKLDSTRKSSKRMAIIVLPSEGAPQRNTSLTSKKRVENINSCGATGDASVDSHSDGANPPKKIQCSAESTKHLSAKSPKSDADIAINMIEKNRCTSSVASGVKPNLSPHSMPHPPNALMVPGHKNQSPHFHALCDINDLYVLIWLTNTLLKTEKITCDNLFGAPFLPSAVQSVLADFASCDAFFQRCNNFFQFIESGSVVSLVDKPTDPSRLEMMDCDIIEIDEKFAHGLTENGERVKIVRQSLFTTGCENSDKANKAFEAQQDTLMGKTACTCICMPSLGEVSGRAFQWKSVLTWPQRLNKYLFRCSLTDDAIVQTGSTQKEEAHVTQQVDTKDSSTQTFACIRELPPDLAHSDEMKNDDTESDSNHTLKISVPSKEHLQQNAVTKETVSNMTQSTGINKDPGASFLDVKPEQNKVSSESIVESVLSSDPSGYRTEGGKENPMDETNTLLHTTKTDPLTAIQPGEPSTNNANMKGTEIANKAAAIPYMTTVPVAPPPPARSVVQASNKDHLDILMEVCLLLVRNEETSLSMIFERLQLHCKKCNGILQSLDDLKSLLARYGIFTLSETSVRLKDEPLAGTVSKLGVSADLGSYGFINTPQHPYTFYTTSVVFMPKETKKTCFIDYMLKVQSQVEYIAIPVAKLPTPIKGNKISGMRAVLVWKKDGPNSASRFRHIWHSVGTVGSKAHLCEENPNRAGLSCLGNLDSTHSQEDQPMFYLEPRNEKRAMRHNGSQTLSTGGIIMTHYMDP